MSKIYHDWLEERSSAFRTHYEASGLQVLVPDIHISDTVDDPNRLIADFLPCVSGCRLFEVRQREPLDVFKQEAGVIEVTGCKRVIRRASEDHTPMETRNVFSLKISEPVVNSRLGPIILQTEVLEVSFYVRLILSRFKRWNPRLILFSLDTMPGD